MFDWWWEFLYNISKWINQGIDSLYKLFLFLAGAAPADVNQEIAGGADTNILVNIFTDNTIQIVFLGFLGFAALVFMISIIIGIVRTEWASNDNGEGKLKVFKQSLKGFLLVFLIPVLFSIGIWATSVLLSSIVSGMSGTSAGDYSLAQKLFEVCLPESDIQIVPAWSWSYSQLSDFGFNMQEFNYLIAYMGGIIILFIIGLAALNLIERIIDLVFLYLVSPFVIAVSPLDEGNRLGIWKDLVISKLLSVAGMVVCFYIYFLCLPIIDQIFTADTFIVRLGYVLFAIGGALAARKGGLLISNLVGHNTALIEGQQAGQTAQIVGTGFRAGLSLISGLASGAMHMLGRGASALGGAGRAVNTASNVGSAIASTGAAAVNAGMNAANILQNNASTSFSGIMAAAGGMGASMAQNVAQGEAQAATGATTVAQTNPLLLLPPPAQIINSGQGFTTSPRGDSSTLPVEQPTNITKPPVSMPSDTDIRSVMNGTGFNNSGEDKK